MMIVKEASEIQNTIKKANLNQKNVKKSKGEVSLKTLFHQLQNLMEEAQDLSKSMNHLRRDNKLTIK